jgi:hypothetical protein
LRALHNSESVLSRPAKGQSDRDEPVPLQETKLALRKLVEACNRIDILVAREFKLKVNEYDSLLSRSSDKESIAREVHNLNQGLSILMKAATKRQESFKNMLDMAKRFEESNSIEEISALMGVTMLSDYKGHIDGLNEIAVICEKKIYPGIPILTNLMAFATELDKICKWMHDILNYDPTTKEDDILRMVSSIRSQDLGQFNAIFGKLDARLATEEKL